jgi:hypothetical protein
VQRGVAFTAVRSGAFADRSCFVWALLQMWTICFPMISSTLPIRSRTRTRANRRHTSRRARRSSPKSRRIDRSSSCIGETHRAGCRPRRICSTSAASHALLSSAFSLSLSLLSSVSTEGKNIAPTIVLNYMMQSAKKQNKHLPLLQAYNFLGAKAPGINVSDQFMAQLVDVEEELFDGQHNHMAMPHD